MIEAMTATQSVRGRNHYSPNQEDLVLEDLARMERFARGTVSQAADRKSNLPMLTGTRCKAAVASTALSKFESYRATRRRVGEIARHCDHGCAAPRNPPPVPGNFTHPALIAFMESSC
jgi:hypothetical protein